MGGELDKVPISVSNVCHGGFRNFALLTVLTDIIIRCFKIQSETWRDLNSEHIPGFIVRLLVINKSGAGSGKWDYNFNFTGTARLGQGRSTGGAVGGGRRTVMADCIGWPPSLRAASGPD